MILDDDCGERLDPGAFLIGRHARMADWSFKKEQRDFTKLIAKFRAMKWNKANPERHRASDRKYARAHVATRMKQEKARRAKRARERAQAVFVCRGCGAEFCRLPSKVRGIGPVPEFCLDKCRQRFRYHQRTATTERAAS